MKQLKALIIITVILMLSILPFLNISATEYSIPANISDKTVDLTNPVKEIDLSAVKPYIEETGGKVTLIIATDAPQDANVTYSISYTPGQNISPEQASGEIKATVTFNIGDPTKLTSLKIAAATIKIVPLAVSPSPSGSASTSPTGSLDPSESTDPSVSPSGSAVVSPTPTDIITEPTLEITPSPTTRPKVTPEPTKDNYNQNYQTQAPPTLSIPADVETPELIATPHPEEPTSTVPPKKATGAVSSFLIVFIILVLLLAVDIALIVWRSKMGYGQINNGVTRRKIRDDLTDIPESDEVVEVTDETQSTDEE